MPPGSVSVRLCLAVSQQADLSGWHHLVSWALGLPVRSGERKALAENGGGGGESEQASFPFPSCSVFLSGFPPATDPSSGPASHGALQCSCFLRPRGGASPPLAGAFTLHTPLLSVSSLKRFFKTPAAFATCPCQSPDGHWGHGLTPAVLFWIWGNLS